MWLAPLQLLPWLWFPECVGLYMFQALLRNQAFLPPLQFPLIFIARSYEALFFWCWNPELCNLAWGWDGSFTKCPPDFYPPHLNVEYPVPLDTAIALLLPHWVLSALVPHPHSSYLSGWIQLLSILGYQTSIQFNFLAVLGVFNFAISCDPMVVQGGKSCLPMPLWSIIFDKGGRSVIWCKKYSLQ